MLVITTTTTVTIIVKNQLTNLELNSQGEVLSNQCY